MALDIGCPSCGRGLVVSDLARGDRVTCPRCLVEFPVPAAEGSALLRRHTRPQGAAAPPGDARAEGERREAVESCPRCGRDAEPIWLTCPWCDEPLRGRRFDGYGRPDQDVRRDRTATHMIVIILVVLGGVGLAILTAKALTDLSEAVAQTVMFLTVGLLFLVGLVTLVVVARSGGNPGAAGLQRSGANPGAAGFRRVVVGTLATAGFVVFILSCGVIALFIFILIACGPPKGLVDPPSPNYHRSPL